MKLSLIREKTRHLHGKLEEKLKIDATLSPQSIHNVLSVTYHLRQQFAPHILEAEKLLGLPAGNAALIAQLAFDLGQIVPAQSAQRVPFDSSCQVRNLGCLYVFYGAAKGSRLLLAQAKRQQVSLSLTYFQHLLRDNPRAWQCLLDYMATLDSNAMTLLLSGCVLTFKQFIWVADELCT